MKNLLKLTALFALLYAEGKLMGYLQNQFYYDSEEDYGSDDIMESYYADRERFPGYSEAVKTISNSSMGSYDKRRTIEDLPTDETTGYYKAVINIARSNMGSYDKRRTIESVRRSFK